MNTVIAVGGTGQQILHYYLQLFFIGLVPPFRAVVLDTDDIIPSLQAFGSFCRDLQYASAPGAALGAQVPIVEIMPVYKPAGNDTFQVLSGLDNWADHNPHPVEAFFSNSALSQNLQKGLFARPALSSTLSHALIGEPNLRADNVDPTVVLVGSVIGGTGGGMIAPVLDTIYENTLDSGRSVYLRAVLFGEYFEVDEGQIEGGQSRIQSNQTFVLRALEDSNTKLHSYYFVGGPGQSLIERNPNSEKQAMHLPFLSRTHPYWEGVQALHYLLNDTTRNAASKDDPFWTREVNRQLIYQNALYQNAEIRLGRGLDAVNYFINNKLIPRIADDPWPSVIWGKKLARLLNHYWRISARILGKENVHRFPSNVQAELEKLWINKGGYGLSKAFPPISSEQADKISPNTYRKIQWPSVEAAHEHTPLFEGEHTAARRVAATLIYWTLREGLK